MVVAPDAPPQANESSELVAFLASAGLKLVTYEKVAVFPCTDFDVANSDSKKAFSRAANAACVGLFREDEGGWIQKDHTTRLREAKAALPRFAPHYRPTKCSRSTAALEEGAEGSGGGRGCHRRKPNNNTKNALECELFEAKIQVDLLQSTVDIKVCTVLPSLLCAPYSLPISVHLTPFPSLTLFLLFSLLSCPGFENLSPRTEITKTPR